MPTDRAARAADRIAEVLESPLKGGPIFAERLIIEPGLRAKFAAIIREHESEQLAAIRALIDRANLYPEDDDWLSCESCVDLIGKLLSGAAAGESDADAT